MGCFIHTTVNTLHKVDDYDYGYDDNVPLTNSLPLPLLFCFKCFSIVTTMMCQFLCSLAAFGFPLRGPTEEAGMRNQMGGKDRDMLPLVGAVGQQW
jgi:hypothetical protein